MNRKERRAAERSSIVDDGPRDVDDIPLAQPDRSGPKAKTLYELAAEREADLSAAAARRQREINTAVASAAKRSSPSRTTHKVATPTHIPSGHAPPLTKTDAALGTTLVSAPSLTMLHTTLDVLVYHQYRQTIEWGEIAQRSLTALPVLLLIVFLAHATRVPGGETVRQLGFWSVACAAGCYLVHGGNRYPYFAVMKRAPPVGTIWVWCVVEMRIAWALASLVIVAAFTWWFGYTVF